MKVSHRSIIFSLVVLGLIASYASGFQIFISVALLVSAHIWAVYEWPTSKEWPTARRLFKLWTMLLWIQYLALSSYHAEGFGGSTAHDQNIVACIGALFNLLFTVIFCPWMIRPFVKVFSDRIHEIITSTFVVINGTFFIIFPYSVLTWKHYMFIQHPDIVSVLQKIFS